MARPPAPPGVARDPEQLRPGAEKGVAQVLSGAETLTLLNRLRDLEAEVATLRAARPPEKRGNPDVRDADV
jgi:hypothetical protein